MSTAAHLADRGFQGHQHGDHEHPDFSKHAGLPEALPVGEKILWQGKPDFWTLAVRAFHIRKLAIYFALLAAFAVVQAWAQSGADGLGFVSMASSILSTVFVGLIAMALVALLAYFAMRTTHYTITNKRVVLQIGIVLDVSLNLPFSSIESAALAQVGRNIGDIAISLKPGNKVAYLHLWPHAKPWALSRPQPMLRCVPEAHVVAATLTRAYAAYSAANPVADIAVNGAADVTSSAALASAA